MKSIISTIAGALGLGMLCATAMAQPITVGAALSQTGNLAESAEHVRKAFLLWQDEVNARGGMLGRQVELKFYDDRSDPATAVRLYERLITVDKVDLLLGPFGSAATSAASAVNETHKKVMVSFGASSKIYQRGFKYIFQVIAPAEAYLDGVFPLAERAGYKTLAFVARDYVAARDLEREIRKVAPSVGLKLVMSEYYPQGATDFGSFITRARQLAPDIFIGNGSPGEAVEMLRQMKSSQYMPKMWLHNGLAQEDFLKSAGPDAEYLFGMSLYEPELKYRGNPEFVASFTKRWSYSPGYYAAVGWAAAMVLEEAVNKTGSLDQDRLADTLRKLKTETAFGPYAVDATGAQIAKKSMIVQVRNGRRVVVWPDDAKEADPVLPIPAWNRR